MRRFTLRILPLPLLLLLVVALRLPAIPALAQENGQFWVQAFEDRNANGAHDAGEPFLTRGVSVDLLNADGVVVASGTLDDAPYANRGFIGFTYLSTGNYTAIISSPNLTATTPDRVAVTITQGEKPVTVLFGAQPAAAAENAAPMDVGLPLSSETARLALAGFGAITVVGVMVALGLVIYAVVLRRRAPAPVRQTTQVMRPVRGDETGEIRRTGEARRP
jgi:hypothetical protein